MSDFDDFYRGSRETRREFATRRLADLRLDVDHSDPPEVAQRKARETAERQHRHDKLFADGFVAIAGAPLPISTTLATQLGYDVRSPAFTAASEPGDGEVADDYRPA